MAVGIPVTPELVGADTPTLDALIAELPAVGALTAVALAAIWLAWRAIIAAERAHKLEHDTRAEPDLPDKPADPLP